MALDTTKNPGSSGAQRSGGSSQSLGQTTRQQAEELKDKVGDALDWGRSGISDSASAARDSLTEDMQKLRDDLAGMKETLSKFVSEAGGEAGKTAQKIGAAVSAQVGAAASSMAEAGANAASAAGEQVKTFASELEVMARKQPLGALAGALVVGVIIGMIGRGGRS